MKVGIVGAGPAGSSLAFFLSKNNINVTIFDHKYPFEKPCGGMLSLQDYNRFSFLSDFNKKRKLSPLKKYIFKNNKIIELLTDPKINSFFCFDRKDFDKYILEKSLSNSSCSFINDKVISVNRKNNIWNLTLNSGENHKFNVLVGADGFNSIVRKIVFSPFKRESFIVGFGYRIKNSNINYIVTKQINKHIYGFILPGNNTSKVIISCRNDKAKLSKKILNEFLYEFFPKSIEKKFFCGIQPLYNNFSFVFEKCYKKNCYLIGDAAGYSNPINAEGISNAINSAKKLSYSIINNDFSYYSKWHKKTEIKIFIFLLLKKILPVNLIINFVYLFYYNFPVLFKKTFSLFKSFLR